MSDRSNLLAEPAKIFVSIVLDGVGVGDAPDAAAYGDEGSNTLGHVCTRERPHLPNLARFGVGRICSLDGIEASAAPIADFGRMTKTAAGKDSTMGHWELAGVIVERPLPIYPFGFPEELVEAFCREGIVDGVLGNCPASGTAIIAQFGEEHLRTGKPIVYTSGDSVFQIATHTDAYSLGELYRLCEVAREKVCIGEHGVGRVIARPFDGQSGNYHRLSAARKDFSLKPPEKTLQEYLQDAGVRTVSVGKIASLFGNVGFDEDVKTRGDRDGVDKTLEAMRMASQTAIPTFIWANLVDFDELYGHRNDPAGFSRALEDFDRRLPELEAALPTGGHLLLTADHGNDPTFPGTDHTRERVPLLLYKKGEGRGRDLGTRSTFADHAATVAAYFAAPYPGPGTSFIP